MQDARLLKTHTEVFHAGKNFKNTITEKDIKDFGLTLRWDPKERRFEMVYLNRLGYISENNVAFWEPVQETQAPVIKNEHKTESIEGRRRAQVSTPTGHVFDGEGKGKVRQ